MYTCTLDVSWLGQRAVVITGCDSGLGFSLAHWCHQRGLVVVAACHTGHSEAGAISLEEAGTRTGRLIVIRGFDVASEESIRVLGARVEEVMRETGARVHALINNAGVLVLARLEWQTPAMIRAQIQVSEVIQEIIESMMIVIQVNLTGPVLLTQELLPRLRESPGSRVINISSPCAMTRLPLGSVYAASKAGLEAVSEALELEAGEDGVHMIVLDPGTSLFPRTKMASRQEAHYEAMENNMTSPVRMDKFRNIKNILSQIQKPERKAIVDDNLIG